MTAPPGEEEGDYDEDEEDENQFAVRRPQRRQLVVQDTLKRWESGFKLDIPEFKGCDSGGNHISTIIHDPIVNWNKPPNI